MKRTPGQEKRGHGSRPSLNKKTGATGRKPPTGQPKTGHLSEPSNNVVQKAGRPVPERMTERGYGIPKDDPATPVRNITTNIKRIPEPPAR